jgi:hypothetical protein
MDDAPATPTRMAALAAEVAALTARVAALERPPSKPRPPPRDADRLALAEIVEALKRFEADEGSRFLTGWLSEGDDALAARWGMSLGRLADYGDEVDGFRVARDGKVGNRTRWRIWAARDGSGGRYPDPSDRG